MNKQFENNLRHYPHSYLSESELAALWRGTPDSRYSKVKRLLAQGKLLHIRRGLYCLTQELGNVQQPHPFELAQHIYGPSYISLESALSYHQLIPERVYSITSVCIKRANVFQTPLGIFSYLRLPAENFYVGVDLVKEDKNQFLIANPWKAICDYVYCYKKDWRDLKPLTDSLRIEPENLPVLRDEEIQLLDEYYHQRRMTRFLKGIAHER